MLTRRVGSFGPFHARRRIIRAVTPPVLVGLGLVAFAIGALLLRSFGTGYRIGRILSATPRASVAEALELAARGEPRYVRVSGRLDSEEEFEDEHHRPLVFRRVRIETLRGGHWQTVEEHRQAVEFELRDGLQAIAIDHAALDTGLVVIPRESSGTAGEVPDSVPADLPTDTPVRMLVDQVSAVEHASVAGVPVTGADGVTRLTALPDRPLILTTLERDEAMRILAHGRRTRAAAAAVALIGGLVVMALGLGWAFVEALVAR